VIAVQPALVCRNAKTCMNMVWDRESVGGKCSRVNGDNWVIRSGDPKIPSTRCHNILRVLQGRYWLQLCQVAQSHPMFTARGSSGVDWARCFRAACWQPIVRVDYP
jgi:hypothetical protein